MDELRIYVSASTGELAAERALLADAVLPRLRERAAESGREIAFALVDPEARAAFWSLKDRLRAIDACPLFVAFVGERLGAPLPPPQADLVRRYPWLADLAGASLAEAEIVHGALVDRAARRSFLYLRQPDFPVPARERLRFLAATQEEAERLAQLKESLRTSGRPLVDGYGCHWDATARRLVGLEALADRLVDDLWTAVRDEPGLAALRAGAGADAATHRGTAAPAEAAESAEPAESAPIGKPAEPTPPPAPAPPPFPPAADAEAPPAADPDLDLDDTAEVAPPPDVAAAVTEPPSSTAAAAGDSADEPQTDAAPRPEEPQAAEPPAGPPANEPEVDDRQTPPPPAASAPRPAWPPLADEPELAGERGTALPSAPNPIVSSLPPLRNAAERPGRSSSGPWLAIILVLLALVALALWFVLYR